MHLKLNYKVLIKKLKSGKHDNILKIYMYLYTYKIYI